METYAQAMCFQVPRFSVMGISPFFGSTDEYLDTFLIRVLLVYYLGDEIPVC